MATDITPLRRQDGGLAAAVRWHLNHHVTAHPRVLDFFGAKLTVFDAFGSPGDTLLAATVCRHLKKRFPRIRLNLLTPNPDLVRLDPCLETVNAPESTFCVWHWYLSLIDKKDGTTNVLRPTLEGLGIDDYEYRARVYLAPEEIAAAKERLGTLERPIISINTMSREMVKVWPLENWLALLKSLRRLGTVVQLGDDKEPVIEGVVRMAGSLSMRESMAVLSHASLHIGPDSFLMHAANGLDVPAVIIFGGSRTPASLGYAENENLFVPMACGPCWIHTSLKQHCEYGVECMKKIPVEDVEKAVMKLWRTIPGERK